MKIERANPLVSKGWFAGPWNADFPISIGYANEGVDQPHLHSRLREIYLVARGQSELRVEHQTFQLVPGDVVILDPGEAHTFLSSSPDYFHFVLHVPGMQGQPAQDEKQNVPRSRLGL